jgi:ribokinase
MLSRFATTAIVFLNIFVTPAFSNILVVGSANADTFLPVARLPREGENLTLLPGTKPIVDLPGGKGCTQAVAVSKLTDKGCCFVGQFGSDSAAQVLREALEDANVDISACGVHDDLPSGRGYVFLTKSGAVSAVVSGGSNQYGWKDWERPLESENDGDGISVADIDEMLQGVKCILLQREVPEYVNLLIGSRAKKLGNIIVIQDVGGEDRPISSEMLRLCDYVVPNESELKRLIESSGPKLDSGEDTENTEEILKFAKSLQKMGARNVLVTRGSVGSTLLTEDGKFIHQPAYILPQVKVVDETGAGDCYRAAFAVALLEGHSLQKCMQFASAAGSCSVEHSGAVPSTPSRSQVEDRLMQETIFEIPRGDGQPTPPHTTIPRGGFKDDGFPFLIGSRLNSMKDRPELWEGELKNPLDYVKRQSTVRGLTCVDFNYPQHFHSWTNVEAKAALNEAGLVAGAVCLRYPAEFARGAMNHPSLELRRKAIEMTKKAAETALALGCDEVVIWSAFDGYDYPFQVDYDEKWDQLVESFREICDACPSVKFSLEYKPTDENTRFFTVPTTAAALLLVEEIDRPNMGLTLDVGHMLMAGENPGQSVAMVGRKKKLFGIQLNDGFTRLAAEDGLMFGSVHPSMALEIMYQMRRTGFSGHFYFDTFPQRTDPVREAEYNIRQVKKFWAAAGEIDESTIRKVVEEHDAIGALELVNAALRKL